MTKTIKMENTAPGAHACARTYSDQSEGTTPVDQLSCKYFFCQNKIERARA